MLFVFLALLNKQHEFVFGITYLLARDLESTGLLYLNKITPNPTSGTR